MSLKITYFVHGTTFDNEENLSSGWKNIALSPLGIKQSQELPRLLGDVYFDAVFCSDLDRAVQSAKISFEGKFPIFLDARLRECNYGIHNGESSEIVEPLQERMIFERFPD
jgi:broad specificity phosphatase PhoE